MANVLGTWRGWTSPSSTPCRLRFMLLDVDTFRRRTKYDLDQLVDDLQRETRRATPAERTAWCASLPIFADVVAHPSLRGFHLQVGSRGDLMVGQFRTGTILIRRLEPQGEKSWGRSGHAFARVPFLEWHSRTAAARRDSCSGSHASPKFTVDSPRHAAALHHCATACRGPKEPRCLSER